MTHTIEQLEHRLSALERDIAIGRREARRYRRLCAGLGVVMVGGMCAAASMQPIADVIQARRLEVVDPAGNLVFAASADDKGGQMDLWTKNGKNILRASCNSAGGDLAIWNRNDVNVFGAFATPAGGETALWSATGGRGIRSHVDPHGGRLDLYGLKDESQISASIAESGSGGAFVIANSTGKPVFEADASGQNNSGMLSINDVNGEARFVATAVEAGGVSQWLNPSSSVAASIGSDVEGGFVNALNTQGAKVLALTTDADGGGRIDLAAEAGNIVFSVNSVKGAGSGLAMMNPNGHKLVLLGARAQGGLMNIMNNLGVPVFVAGHAETGRGGAVSINNGRGIQVFSVATNEKEDGKITVWNADGKKPRSMVSGD